MLHSLFQEGGGEPPHSSLGWAIDTHFGSLEALIQKMSAEGAALQGSGWVVSTVVGFKSLQLFHSLSLVIASMCQPMCIFAFYSLLLYMLPFGSGLV